MIDSGADKELEQALAEAAAARNVREQDLRLDKFVAFLETEGTHLSAKGYQQLLDAEFLTPSEKARYASLILEVHRYVRPCCDEEGPLRTVSRALRENTEEAYDAFLIACHPALCGAGREWLDRNRAQLSASAHGARKLRAFVGMLVSLEAVATSEPSEE